MCGVLHASIVLRNHDREKVDVWLIISRSENRCDDDVSSPAVQEYADFERLLRLDPAMSHQEQAESLVWTLCF